MALILVLIGLYATAFVARPVVRHLGRDAGCVLAVVFGVGVIALVPSAVAAVQGDGPSFSVPWIPALGIEFSLTMDALAALFAGLVLGIGSVVMAYSARYLSVGGDHGQLFARLTFFAASMLGLVLAGDAVLLFVFWELTSVASFLLIGDPGTTTSGPARDARVRGDRARRPRAARGDRAPDRADRKLGSHHRARRSSGRAGLADVRGDRPAAVGRRCHEVGAVPVPLLAARGHGGPDTGEHLPALGHHGQGGHLPVAAHGPPVRRRGLVERDRGVARSEHVGHGRGDRPPPVRLEAAARVLDREPASGFLAALAGLGTHKAILAACALLVAHALYKATLFMVVGIVDREAGSRDIRELSGLRRAMPLTALATGLAGLSMAGIPPLLGFVSKEEAFSAFLSAPGSRFLGPLAIVLAVTGIRPHVRLRLPHLRGAFGGPLVQRLYEPTRAFLLPPLVTSVSGLVLGIGVGRLLDPIARAVAFEATGRPGPYHLALWHGFTPALMASIVTISAGLVIVATLRPVSTFLERHRSGVRGADLFDRGYAGLLTLGGRVASTSDADAPAPFLLAVLLTVIVVSAGAWMRWGAELDLGPHGAGNWATGRSCCCLPPRCSSSWHRGTASPRWPHWVWWGSPWRCSTH